MNIFSIFMGNFCPTGSRSRLRIQIRIQGSYWIRIRNTSFLCFRVGFRLSSECRSISKLFSCLSSRTGYDLRIRIRIQGPHWIRIRNTTFSPCLRPGFRLSSECRSSSRLFSVSAAELDTHSPKNRLICAHINDFQSPDYEKYLTWIFETKFRLKFRSLNS